MPYFHGHSPQAILSGWKLGWGGSCLTAPSQRGLGGFGEHGEGPLPAGWP